MNMVHFFGVITEYFTSNDSHRSKTCFPNYAFWGYYLFHSCKFLFQFQPIFLFYFFSILSQKNISDWPAKYNTHFYFMNFSTEKTSKDPIWTW